MVISDGAFVLFVYCFVMFAYCSFVKQVICHSVVYWCFLPVIGFHVHLPVPEELKSVMVEVAKKAASLELKTLEPCAW